jgi:hypothetical protein
MEQVHLDLWTFHQGLDLDVVEREHVKLFQRTWSLLGNGAVNKFLLQQRLVQQWKGCYRRNMQQ